MLRLIWIRYLSVLVLVGFFKAETDGAPGKIRTPDPLIRSQVLYPAELPVRMPLERKNCNTGLSSIMQARGGLYHFYSAFGNRLR